MKHFWKRERGEVIVEATIIFPIMFLVVFLMLYAGNAYFQKSRIEAVVTEMAYYGSAQCADPLLKQVQENKKVPGFNANYDIQPYRYIVGNMGKIEQDVEKQIQNKISKMGTGLFNHMKPNTSYLDAKFNNAYIYSTFSVEVHYKIPFPIRLMGMKDNFSMEVSSRCDVPVSDVPEFIRNVDMIEDWMEASEEGQKLIQKTQDALSKIDKYVN